MQSHNSQNVLNWKELTMIIQLLALHRTVPRTLCLSIVQTLLEFCLGAVTTALEILFSA